MMNYDANVVRISFIWPTRTIFAGSFVIDVCCCLAVCVTTAQSKTMGPKELPNREKKQIPYKSHKSQCLGATLPWCAGRFDFSIRRGHSLTSEATTIINRSGKTIIHLPEKLNVHFLSNKCDARKSMRNSQSTAIAPIVSSTATAKLKIIAPISYRMEASPDFFLINYFNEYERTICVNCHANEGGAAASTPPILIPLSFDSIKFYTHRKLSTHSH